MRAPGRCKDLRGYLDLLERHGLLRHVTAEVGLEHEIGAIAALSLDAGGPGILFQNMKGRPGKKLVINILSTTEQVALAFGTEADDGAIVDAIHHGKANPIPPKVVETGTCQEVVLTGKDVDLCAIPTPIWHEQDGGPYIGTTAGVITMDPDSGSINCGTYRCMTLDRNHLSINNGNYPVGAHPDPAIGRKGGGYQVLKWEQQGKNAPVAIAIGMDPLMTYASAQAMPAQDQKHAEYAAAGAWHGEPLELVKCVSNDLLVPAWSEIVLEGEVLRDRRTKEGPWGENADIYASSESAMVMQVNCITHRKDPINYGGTCRPLMDYPKFLAGAALKSYLAATLDLVRDAYLFPSTGNRPLMVVSARVRASGDVDRIVEAVAAMPNESYLLVKPRWLVIVDEDAEIRDYNDMLWRFTLAVRPEKDVRVTEVGGGRYARIPMLVVDATFRNKPELEWGPGVGETTDPPVAKTSRALREKVRARWHEYGLD